MKITEKEILESLFDKTITLEEAKLLYEASYEDDYGSDYMNLMGGWDVIRTPDQYESAILRSNRFSSDKFSSVEDFENKTGESFETMKERPFIIVNGLVYFKRKRQNPS